jgi:hypothetical protein
MVLILYLAQLLQLAVDTETMVKIPIPLVLVDLAVDTAVALGLFIPEVLEHLGKVIMAVLAVAHLMVAVVVAELARLEQVLLVTLTVRVVMVLRLLFQALP